MFQTEYPSPIRRYTRIVYVATDIIIWPSFGDSNDDSANHISSSNYLSPNASSMLYAKGTPLWSGRTPIVFYLPSNRKTTTTIPTVWDENDWLVESVNSWVQSCAGMIERFRFSEAPSLMPDGRGV